MLELLLLLGSAVVSFLYAWLGLAYAIALMLILHMLGVQLGVAIPVILASQIIAASLGVALRRDHPSKRRSVKSSAVIAVAALSAYLSALLVGVSLDDYSRLIGLMLILLVSAAINFMGDRWRREDPPNSTAIDVATGISAGVVKGVFGGGITPMLIATQRLGGLGIDETLFRTLFAHIIMCLTALVPYVLRYGFDLEMFTFIVLGSVVGVLAGYLLLRRVKPSIRVKLASTVMVALAIALFIKLLFESLGVY